MLIANPIYDTAFKRLLENDRVAKFLIGTILDCKVLSLEPKIQERTKFDEETGRLTLYRKDFTAAIKTPEGEKTVIIEMQKAKVLNDVYRFRKYLGGEYAGSKYPIISIYILGFNLSVDSPAFVADIECRNLQTNERLEVRDSFVEHLTHKAYFVQTKRIKQSLNTKLDMLLSVFEQDNFVSRDKTLIEFADVSDPELRAVLDILHYVAVDKDTRKELDDELYYLDYVEETFGEERRKLAEKDIKLTEQAAELAEQAAELAEQAAELAEKDKIIEADKTELAEQAAELAELRKKLEKYEQG